jgi:hypothetical protein
MGKGFPLEEVRAPELRVLYRLRSVAALICHLGRRPPHGAIDEPPPLEDQLNAVWVTR